MLSIISLLVIVFLSIIITRVATIALTHTGMMKEAAKFQARSAFTRAGFTTSESEKVVNHPVRRKIVQMLMLIGNAGIVVAVSSLILTFVSSGDTESLTTRVVLLISGMVALWALATSKWADRKLSHYVNRILSRHTDLGVRDYSSLLHLAGDFRLAEMEIQESDWLNGKLLADARLRSEGINVLGIKKPDGTYYGNPQGETRIIASDTLILYGRVQVIEELDRRRDGFQGDRKHRDSIKEQSEIVREEIDRKRQQEHGEKPDEQ